MTLRRHRLETYTARLYGYGYSLSGSRERALELVQECCARALAATRPPSDEPAFRAWLFRILRNTFLDGLRKAGEFNAPLDAEGPPPDGPLSACEESLVNQLTVRVGLERICPKHREVIALIDIAGFTYAEAAEVLRVPRGTVMSRLSRARQSLLAEIADQNVHALPAGGKREAR